MGRPPCCDKANVKRGSWTPEEDAKILAYVSRHGTGNWTMVPQKAGWKYQGHVHRIGRQSILAEIVSILKGLFPGLQLPDKCVDSKSVVSTFNFTVSIERAKDLGIQFIPLEVSVKDAVESLREKGLVSF